MPLVSSKLRRVATAMLRDTHTAGSVATQQQQQQQQHGHGENNINSTVSTRICADAGVLQPSEGRCVSSKGVSVF